MYGFLSLYSLKLTNQVQ